MVSMAFGDQAGIEAVNKIAAVVLPQVKEMLGEVVRGVSDAVAGVQKTVADTLPVYADGVSQVLVTLDRIESRLDGAEIDISPFTIGGAPVSGITIKLRCPLPKEISSGN